MAANTLEAYRFQMEEVCEKEQQCMIARLVNGVSLLQRHFAYCKPFLVVGNHIKYAYKNARCAVVSQITQLNEAIHGKCLKEQCVICFENINSNKMFSVDGCLHRYCISCIKKYVEVKLLVRMEVKCPHEGCNSKVSIDNCKKFLVPKLVEVLRQKMKELAIPINERVYCPYPKCSALMSKKEVSQYTKTIRIHIENSETKKCMKCRCFFCIECKVPWHSNMTCNEYKRSESYFRSEDAKLESLRKAKQWSKCAKCQSIVELAGGCYHIYCRCGYQFCYICGAEWKNKKATCSCRIWDERNIIRNEMRRR